MLTKKKRGLILMFVLMALPFQAFYAESFSQKEQLRRVDELLAEPQPHLPEGLRENPSAERARQSRISRQLKELFPPSPSTQPIPWTISESAKIPVMLGPERDGWTVSVGTTLAYYQSPSAAACRSDCARDVKCSGYTWVKPGGYQAGDPPMCYLMSSIKQTKPHSCCITAVKSDASTETGREDSYLGCFQDRVGDRDLNGYHIEDYAMTTERCINICRDKNFAYAGTQYYRHCFCGNSYGKYGKANGTDCSYKCSGNPNQNCGGYGVNSVYAVGRSGGSGIVISSGDLLGRVWQESESSWNGTWTRRGNSNTFDAVWTNGTGRVTAILNIQIQDNRVSIARRQGSDGNKCNYTGTLAIDRRSVSGTYTCDRYPGPFSWNAWITGGDTTQ